MDAHEVAGELDDWQQMIKLDLEVPMRLTRRLSPAMVCSFAAPTRTPRGRGTVLQDACDRVSGEVSKEDANRSLLSGQACPQGC